MPINENTLLAGTRPRFRFYKPSATSRGAGFFHSLWSVTGNPTAGATPPTFTAGAGYVPTRTTSGSFQQTNAASGNELRFVALDASAQIAGQLTIYDRLWHCSGFSTTVTTTQTITTPGSLPVARSRDGAGDFSDVEIWLEIYGAPGATAATWTVSAWDGGSTSRNYTYAKPGTAEIVGQMIMVSPPANATPGCTRVETFTCSASSGTAGNVGITLLRPLVTLDLPIVNVGAFRGALDLGLAQVRDDACLAMMVQCTSSSTGLLLGGFALSEVNPA